MILLRKPPYSQAEVAEQIRQVTELKQAGDKHGASVAQQILHFMLEEVEHQLIAKQKKH